MPFQDNRQFVETLQKTGDAVVVQKEVDWDLEAGAIARIVNETWGPAVLLEKIKDYPAGYRLLGSPLANFRRVAVAMGMSPETCFPDLLEEYDKRLRKPIKPVTVTKAPCKEVIIEGKDVDLFDFPAPMIHEGDGGRYIGTWHILVTRDPVTGWNNWGMYRVMLYDRTRMVGMLDPDQQGPSIVYANYQRSKKPVPFAIAIGADPISSFTAGNFFGRCEDETGYAGALRQAPVELVKCHTNDLQVPAHAEIILEGEIYPDIGLTEGPFGEFPGYSASPRRTWPMYRVTAVTHRNDPILTMSCVGFPTDESHIVGSLGKTHSYRKKLLDSGIPVADLFVPPQCGGMLVVVAIDPPYPNMARRIGKIIMTGRLPHYVIVVDGDTCVHDMDEVMHAIASTCHPVRGITSYDRDVGSPLVPFYTMEEKKWGVGAKAILDCTFPPEWGKEKTPRKMNFNRGYPESIRDKVLKNWKKYGFK
ncbi:MAG: UbiD family decarboxylase [Chloroflexi bacterium]|nr:UbiD family decarboxylase [Chloroflexota bacterium]